MSSLRLDKYEVTVGRFRPFVAAVVAVGRRPSAQANTRTCVNWDEAFAFCIWDDGVLPSEAEWEYADAGGRRSTRVPVGSTDRGTTPLYAIYGCNVQADGGLCRPAPVGSATMGAGKWGQHDLAGNVSEWTADFYASYVDPCTDCVNATTIVGARVMRGVDFFSTNAQDLAPPGRYSTMERRVERRRARPVHAATASRVPCPPEAPALNLTFLPMFAFLLASVTACTHAPDVPGYPLYEASSRLPRAQVARLFGPIDSVDGRNVVGLGDGFEVLPGCHVVRTRSDVVESTSEVQILGHPRGFAFAIHMQAGFTYVVKRQVLGDMGSQVRFVTSADEIDGGGHVGTIAPAKNGDELEACRDAGGT